PEDFGSVDEAVAYLRPHVTLASSAAEAALRHRVEHGVKKLPSGRYTWKYDGFLRDQRRRGTVPPVALWPAAGKLTAPPPVSRGGESGGSWPDTAKRMLELIPGSQLVEIPGAGHSVPAEAPEAFERAVRQFLGA